MEMPLRIWAWWSRAKVWAFMGLLGVETDQVTMRETLTEMGFTEGLRLNRDFPQKIGESLKW